MAWLRVARYCSSMIAVSEARRIGCEPLGVRPDRHDLPDHRRQPTAADQQVQVGSEVVRIGCHGARRGSAPVVVLEAGAGNGADSWNQVFPAVAEFARVCAYDRPAELEGREPTRVSRRHAIAYLFGRGEVDVRPQLSVQLLFRQTKEIGIRMALGAQRTRVVAQLISRAARLTMIGIAFGLPLAWRIALDCVAAVRRHTDRRLCCCRRRRTAWHGGARRSLFSGMARVQRESDRGAPARITGCRSHARVFDGLESLRVYLFCTYSSRFGRFQRFCRFRSLSFLVNLLVVHVRIPPSAPPSFTRRTRV